MKFFWFFSEFIWIYFELKRIKDIKFITRADVAQATMTSPCGGVWTCHVAHAYVYMRVRAHVISEIKHPLHDNVVRAIVLIYTSDLNCHWDDYF